MIYFLYSGKANRIKIVSSDSIEELMASLQKVFEPLKLLAEIPGMRDQERELHDKFLYESVGDGGWFRLSDAFLCLASEF